MKKKFSDYASQQNDKQTTAEYASQRQNGEKPSGMNSAAFEMLKSIAGRYEGASETDLIKAIMAEAAKARKAGRLSDEEIDSFANQVLPMLDKSQRKRLLAVVEQIKNTK